jgi:ABC-type transport system substrate-binding protein
MLAKIGVQLSFTVHGADYFTLFTKGPVGFTFKNLWTNMFDASILFSSSKYTVPACCNAAFAKIPALDKAFDDWQHARTTAQLKSAASRAQLVAAQQLPFIPIVTPRVVWVHTKKVHGWVPTEPNLYPFYNDVWIG